MPGKAEILLNTFGGGVLSPKLYGRTDVQKYHSGCRQIKNFIVTPQGTVVRRPGTYFVKEVKTSAKYTRLVPFIASSETAYILEFGDSYVRFYTNGANVTSGGSPVEVATPWDESEIDDLQIAQSVDVLYICHKDHAPRCLNHVSSTSWTLTEFGFENGPFLSENELDDGTSDEDVELAVDAVADGATGVTISATKAGAAFALFQGDTGDIGRLVRIRHELKWGTIRITAGVSTSSATGTIEDDFLYTTPSKHWRLGAWSPYMGYPRCVTFHQQRLAFARTAMRPQTVWLSVTGDFTNFDPNVEMAGANYISNGSFDNADTNWLGTSGWDFASVPGKALHTSGTTKLYQNVGVIDGHSYRHSYTITNQTAGTLIASQVSNGITTSGPTRTASGKYEEYFTANATAGAFYGFTPNDAFDGELDDVALEDTQDIAMTGDDSAISLTISSDTLDAVTWLMSQGPALLMGSIGGVYSLLGVNNAAITPTSFTLKRENVYPAKTMQPVPFGHSTVYVQKGGLVVRDIGYDIQSDAYGAVELTIFADHITESGIIAIARQMSPFQILWMVRTDGKLVGLTYEKDQQVVAWHLHETEGTYESVAVIPGTTEDQVWFVIKRTVNGSDVRYVEYADVINFASLYDSHNVDCGVYETGTDMTSVATLTHLEGCSVQVAGDGTEQADATVSSGSITVTACDYCHAGLEYDSILESMDMDPGGTTNSILMRMKRIIESTFLFYRAARGVKGGYVTATSNVGYGYAYNLNVIIEEDETAIVLEGAEDSAFAAGYLYAAVEHVETFDLEAGRIYTGKKRLSSPSGWSDTATVYAVMSSPLPCGINAILSILEVSER